MDHDEVNRLQGKDLIVRNADIFIDKEVFTYPEQKLSLFIDRGNLILDNSIDGTSLQSFDKNGYRVINGGVTKGLYLQGNFIINGLLLGAPAFNNTSYSSIPAKTFIHGKFASLNLPTASYINREKQINTMFGGDQQQFNGIHFISLNDLFSRRCADIGTGAGY